jgi:hypothetical protein
MMLATNGLHVVSISEQVRPSPWRYAVVNSVREVLALLAINDALALRMQTNEPETELLPAWGLVHQPHWVSLFGFVFLMLSLLCVLRTEPVAFHQCWTAGSVAGGKGR